MTVCWMNEWFILPLKFYYRNILQILCLLPDLKDNPVWLSSSDLQFRFWEHHESLNLNLFVFCFEWNPLSGNLPWWLHPGLYLFILLSGSSHSFIPLKERKINRTLFLSTSSQHFWHQMCEFCIPSNSPIICRHELGVWQFNWVLALTAWH